jgi:hypothetical protein
MLSYFFFRVLGPSPSLLTSAKRRFQPFTAQRMVCHWKAVQHYENFILGHVLDRGDRDPNPWRLFQFEQSSKNA